MPVHESRRSIGSASYRLTSFCFMNTIRVALDWVPNTIHTGLLVASTRGFYREAGLEVEFLSPSDDQYAVTPAKKLSAGLADLAICPSESVISFAEGTNRSGGTFADRIEAVFALLDKDASSILCSRASGINRPRDLDGKNYGSYNARYEDEIVRAMVQNDGGRGEFAIVQNTGKLDLFDALTTTTDATIKDSRASERVDATWIFRPWEGLRAQQIGFDGVQFDMAEYGIPYGYPLVVARLAGGKGLADEILQRFVQATRRGYQFATRHHEDTVDVLVQHCKTENREFLSQSLALIRPYWSREEHGCMSHERWSAFLRWLQERSLLGREIEAASLFHNPLDDGASDETPSA